MSEVLIGRVGRPHGLDGEVNLEHCPLSADELLETRRLAWRGLTGEQRVLEVASARPAHDRLLVRFAGVSDRDQASRLTRGELFTDSERLPDPGPGLAYAFQLIGMRVETEDGRALGTLRHIMATGANPIYVVEGAKELLVPATEEVVRRVDRERGVIVVALPRGLEDL
jgi:16S rRNA processing protein RimM